MPVFLRHNQYLGKMKVVLHICPILFRCFPIMCNNFHFRVRQQVRKGQYNPVILTGDLCLRSPHAKIIRLPLRSVDYFLWGPQFSKNAFSL